MKKGQTCTSCAADVPEDEVPLQSSIEAAAASASASAATTPEVVQSPTSSKSVGTKSISPQIDASAEENPTVIPMPLVNTYVASIWIDGEERLTKNNQIIGKMNELKLNNTDIFFLEDGLGFKLLKPPSNFTYPNKAKIINLTPIELPLDIGSQIRISIVPQPLNDKVYRFTIKPARIDSSTVKLEAS